MLRRLRPRCGTGRRHLRRHLPYHGGVSPRGGQVGRPLHRLLCRVDRQAEKQRGRRPLSHRVGSTRTTRRRFPRHYLQTISLSPEGDRHRTPTPTRGSLGRTRQRARRLDQALHRLPGSRHLASKRDGRPDDRPPLQVLHHHQRRAPQAQCHRRVSTLRPTRRRTQDPPRYPLRRLRPPRRRSLPGRQGYATWLLLAHRTRRCCRHRPAVRRVPEVRQADDVPSSALKTIPITWPFPVWGMDMVGPFKKAPSGYTHLLVAVDKFTKWVEAKPVRKCDGKTATKFLRELIYRYGLPNSIITDNGTNFAKGAMAEFCEEHHIRLDLASVAHPESNGQAERANQSILHGLKPRLQVPLERTAGCWVEELPSVIWGIRTSVNRSTGFTPFFMVYGAEAVMPTDLEHDSPRVVHYTEAANELARQDGVDQLDEARNLARSRTAIYQQGLRRYHSRRVKTRTFQEGDLVLRLIQDKKGMHKLSPMGGTIHHRASTRQRRLLPHRRPRGRQTRRKATME